MHFVQWLSSLDELLFELMSWLVFFPVTLWRTLTRPLETMRYAQTQQALARELQYRGAVHPPVMLILATVVSQAVGLAIDGTSPIVTSHRGLANLVDDNTTLLLLRITLFGVFALIVAVRKVLRSGVELTRDTLKAPFYAQCYFVSSIALLVSIGVTAVGHGVPWVRAAGALLLMGALVFYVIVEVRWFARELDQSIGRSILDAGRGTIESVVVFFLASALFVQ